MSKIITYWADFKLVIFFRYSEVVIIFGNYLFLNSSLLLLINWLWDHLHVEYRWRSELLQFWNDYFICWLFLKLWSLLLGKTSVLHLFLNWLRQLRINLCKRIVDHIDKSLSNWCHLIHLIDLLRLITDESVLMNLFIKRRIFREEIFKFLS